MRVAVLTESGRAEIPRGQVEQSETVALLGYNTGNVAFQQVVAHHLTEPLAYRSWRHDPAEVAREFDVIVIPEASVMASGKDFGWKAHFLQSCPLPAVVLGLGFQDGHGGADPEVPNGTRRYLALLSERATSLSVRGERSADLVNRLGITNVVIGGCPSIFWSRSPLLGAQIGTALEELGDVARPAACAGPDKRMLRRTNRRLFDWVSEKSGSWIVQSGRGLAAAMSGSQYVPERRRLSVLARRRFSQRANPLFFTSGREWIEHLRSVDLSVSPRIHGAILATQAAVPSICVVHDGRTRELAATCRLPTVTPQQVESSSDISELARSTPFDSGAFDEARRSLARQYSSLLRASGLSPVDWLVHIGEEHSPA